MSTTTNTKLFVMTPVGSVDYPYILKPDHGNEKFQDAIGTYKVKNVQIPKSPESDKLFAQLTAAADKAYAESAAKAAAAKKRPPKRAEMPIFETADGYSLTAKLKAGGVNSKTKQQFTQAPRVFGPDNKLWDKSKAITNGSKIRLVCEVVPYDSPTSGVGITLRMKDVQVVELGVANTDDSPFSAFVEEPSFGDVGQMSEGNSDFDDI